MGTVFGISCRPRERNFLSLLLSLSFSGWWKMKYMYKGKKQRVKMELPLLLPVYLSYQYRYVSYLRLWVVKFPQGAQVATLLFYFPSSKITKKEIEIDKYSRLFLRFPPLCAHEESSTISFNIFTYFFTR